MLIQLLTSLKVKLSNTILEFSNLEVVHSNVISITGSANGLLNTTSLPFQSNTFSGNTTTAIATIESIGPSGFIAEKNAFTQNPVVRLFEILPRRVVSREFSRKSYS